MDASEYRVPWSYSGKLPNNSEMDRYQELAISFGRIVSELDDLVDSKLLTSVYELESAIKKMNEIEQITQGLTCSTEVVEVQEFLNIVDQKILKFEIYLGEIQSISKKVFTNTSKQFRELSKMR